MARANEQLIVIRHAPYSSNALREGLDVALVAAAFGQSVSLLFLGQGVLALLKEQKSGAPGQKATLPTIDMLEMYDIENILVPLETLMAFNIRAEQLVEGVTLVTTAEIPELFQRYPYVLNF
ncbi:sulfurtransferase complex subunit TusC [Halomonas qinghailakensis]|uniref:Sulfurtransferase complex subunit TusC n=2 Tax=Halomonas TaxID=2745 RepID=A0AA46TQQ2_9GAMM|nr:MULTISPECIES: sulfurtransferase complex subunit TusC [Halomonas]UYO74458.1 sulfurtransferase complex subunit TusC [Halomonas sp. ZZQ-149]UYV20633.1 sulfurtransferase complex subunit TusC [Halomonas qaidamensis]